MRKRETVLTARMLEILSGLALGKTRLEVAADLGLSPSTVKGYLNHAFNRLGAVSLLDAILKTRDIYPDLMGKAYEEIGEARNKPENVRVRVEEGQLLVTFEMSVRLPLDYLEGVPSRKNIGMIYPSSGPM